MVSWARRCVYETGIKRFISLLIKSFKPKSGLVNEPGGYAGVGLEELMSRTVLQSPL